MSTALPLSGTAFKTIVFAAGGTGGHVGPAIALAEEIESRPGCPEVLFLGSDRPGEQLMLDGRNHVDIAPPRLVPTRPLRTWHRLTVSRESARAALVAHGVGAVIATGGYVCLPTILAARQLNIPYWLLEQNQIAGRVVRWLGWGARGVIGPVGMQHRGVRPWGVPVRRVIRRARRSTTNDTLNILVCGGSQGSRSLDRRWPRILRRMAEGLPLKIKHVCRPEEQPLDYGSLDVSVVTPSPDFPQWLADADLLLGRAGGSTLAEAFARGCPMILTPLPSSRDDHQRANALEAVRLGTAAVVEEYEADIVWESTLRDLLEPSRRVAVAQAAAGCDRPGLTRQIVDLVLGAAS